MKPELELHAQPSSKGSPRQQHLRNKAHTWQHRASSSSSCRNFREGWSRGLALPHCVPRPGRDHGVRTLWAVESLPGQLVQRQRCRNGGAGGDIGVWELQTLPHAHACPRCNPCTSQTPLAEITAVGLLLDIRGRSIWRWWLGWAEGEFGGIPPGLCVPDRTVCSWQDWV